MNRQESAFVAAGLLLSMALLRMAAPRLPFDPMTLALLLMAALMIYLSPFSSMGGRQRRGEGPSHPTPSSPIKESAQPMAMEALAARMEQVTWPAGADGPFHALSDLYQEKPFQALCAQWGLLHLFSKTATIPEGEGATIALLLSAMEEATSQGEEGAQGEAMARLFAYGLRALPYLQQHQG